MGAERRERQKRAQEKRALQDRSPVAPEVSSPQDKTNYGLGNGADTSKNRFGFQAWTTDADHTPIEAQSVSERLQLQLGYAQQQEAQAPTIGHPTDALQQLLNRRADNTSPRGPMEKHPLYGDDDSN
jgi:hypothetical protein